jgi:SNF2 family DNA or RNA helicase
MADKNGKLFRRGSLRWKLAMRKLMIAKGKRKFDQSKMPEFLELIKPWTMSIKADDVLDLPSLEVVPTPIKVFGAQRRLYEELENKAIALYNEGKIKAAMKVIKNAKLRQICGGYIRDEEGEVHEVGRAKLRKVLEIVRREQKPIVIFCWYLEEIAGLDRKLRSLGYAVDYIIGANRKRRSLIQADFQKGLIDVLICQQRTGGVGVDLFRSCRGILYSISHSSIDFDQCIKRLRRRGQTKPVKFWALYVKDTVDEDPFVVVNDKGSKNELLLKRLKRSL